MGGLYDAATLHAPCLQHLSHTFFKRPRKACKDSPILVYSGVSSQCATARLAQSAERKALNLVVVGSSSTVGVLSVMEQLV